MTTTPKNEEDEVEVCPDCDQPIEECTCDEDDI